MPIPRLILHSWTVDRTPLADLPAVARAAGWDALELRQTDFMRVEKRGGDVDAVIAGLLDAGVPVECVGAPSEWIADGSDAEAGLAAFTLSCRRAQSLGAPRVMSRVSFAAPPTDAHMTGFRILADTAESLGLKLALEFDSGAACVNALAPMRAFAQVLDHPNAGLLLDTYHLARSGASAADIAAVPGAEIAYVQFSDSTFQRGETTPLDRVAPGRGEFPMSAFAAAILATGYTGPFSFEAPNRDTWALPAEDAARDALVQTHAMFAAAG